MVLALTRGIAATSTCKHSQNPAVARNLLRRLLAHGETTLRQSFSPKHSAKTALWGQGSGTRPGTRALESGHVAWHPYPRMELYPFARPIFFLLTRSRYLLVKITADSRQYGISTVYTSESDVNFGLALCLVFSHHPIFHPYKPHNVCSRFLLHCIPASRECAAASTWRNGGM